MGAYDEYLARDAASTTDGSSAPPIPDLGIRPVSLETQLRGEGAAVKRNRTKARWYCALAAIAVLALAGCGGGSGGKASLPSTGAGPTSPTPFGSGPTATSGGVAASTPGQPVGTGYLNTDTATYANFIQWTKTGGTVSGTMQEDSLAGTAPSEQLVTSTDAVTGEIVGSHVSLSFKGANQLFGTLSGGDLHLNIPQQNGTLALATFTPASPAAFNKVAREMQTQVSKDNQAATVQQQIQNEQAAIDKAASTVEQDLSTLANDQSKIAQALDALPGSLVQEKSGLATTASDEQKVLSEVHTNPTQVCTDALNVNDDALNVNYDALNVNDDAIGVENSVSRNSFFGSVQNDISTIQQDFQALVAVQQAQRDYQDGAPTAADVSQAIATLNAAISSAVKSTNADIAIANQYNAQAFQDAATAMAAGSSCGAASTPTPLQPIHS